MSVAGEFAGKAKGFVLRHTAGVELDEPEMGDLSGCRTRLRLTTIAGLILLVAAVALIIGMPAGPAPIVLAGIATLLLAADPRFGPLPAALVVMVALPFGRGADTSTFEIHGLPLRPADAAVVVGLLCALPSLRRPRREDRLPLALLAAFLAVGGIATLFGLVDHYNVRDIFRDARWWVLYAFLGIALLTRAPRASILRGLLLGSTVFAIAAIATTVLPAYAGGLKSAALLYDRGTLRMQFDNTIFLIPAIAFVAWRAFVRRSWFDAPLLALLFVALTLSLTRTSVLVSFGMIALIGAAAIVGPDRTKTRPALLWAGILGFVVLASFAAGLALDVAGTPAVAAKPGQTVKTGQETPLDRMLFTSPESNLDTTSSSDSGRLTSFRNAIKAIEQSPIVGRGMGSLIPVPFAYNNDRASTYGKQPGVDNAYLTVGLKAGVIGVLALVALLAWAALGSIQKPSLRSWLIPAWLAIGVMTMTQSFAVSSYGPFGLALMMALTAWGYTASKGSTALSQV